MAASFAMAAILSIIPDGYGKKAVKFRNHLTERSADLLRYRDTKRQVPAYLDVMHTITWTLIELYQTHYEPEIFKKAQTNDDNKDHSRGRDFSFTEVMRRNLIARPKYAYDGLPGNHKFSGCH